MTIEGYEGYHGDEEYAPLSSRGRNTTRTPRRKGDFAKTNTSTVLPQFVNSEQDFIRCAFSPANWTRLKELPNTLKHNKVFKHRTVERLAHLGSTKAGQVTKNTLAETQATRFLLPPKISPPGTAISLPDPSPRNFKAGDAPAFKIPQQSEPPLSNRSFGEFAYQESPYDATDTEKMKDRRQSLLATQSISKKPFVCSDDHALARHERFQEYLIEPYQAPIRAVTRIKKPLLRGAFVPTVGGKALSNGIGPKKLGVVLTSLRKELEADWRLCSFTLHGSPKEPVTISFKLSTVENEHSLTQYMTNMAKMNPIINENNFHKIHSLWAYKPGDGYVHYCFKPPWWVPPRAKHSVSYGSPAYQKHVESQQNKQSETTHSFKETPE